MLAGPALKQLTLIKNISQNVLWYIFFTLIKEKKALQWNKKKINLLL